MVGLWLFFTLFGLVAPEFEILLLHVNDLHGHLQQAGANSEICEDDSRTDCYGGFARLKTLVDQKSEEAASKGTPTIFLHGGDTFQGTPFYTFYKWEIIAQFMNFLGIHAMSLGNHDFDDGISGLVPFVNNISIPVVCANLNTTLEPSMNLTNLTPSKTFVFNSTKIGVIGYLTPETELISNPDKIKIMDEITYVRKEAQKLVKEGVNIVIALGHSGYSKDQEIAKEIEEIDLVVGGHSHTFLYNGTPPDSDLAKGPYPTVVTQSSGKQVPVVQAYKHSKYLGYLELKFDNSGNVMSWNGQPILLRGNLTQDVSVLEALKPYEEKVYEKVKEILATTEVLLDADNEKCKRMECNFGNLITDAYVDYVVRHFSATTGWAEAAIGLVHGGEISGSISKNSSLYGNGSLTIEDLYGVLEPTSSVVMIYVTGSALHEALETSISNYYETGTEGNDYFLQLSGLRVVYDVGRPSGSRVVTVHALCADCDVPEYLPLQFNKTYGVVLPHYLSGGETFSSLLTYNPVILDDLEYMIVAEYIQNHNVMYPKVEYRITILNSTAFSSASKIDIFVFQIVIFFTMVYYFKST